jgi:hypothetical protein
MAEFVDEYFYFISIAELSDKKIEEGENRSGLFLKNKTILDDLANLCIVLI